MASGETESPTTGRSWRSMSGAAHRLSIEGTPMTVRPLRLRGAGALAAAAALLVSGCSATGSSAGAESSGDSGSAPTGVELTAGQFSWTAAADG